MRRVEPAAQAFQAPVDVHASADGQVYMFRRQRAEPDSSEEEQCEDLNVIELSPLVHSEQDRLDRVQLLERELQEGDNLNKLALQYGVKVADIKRVNGLFHDQDLFALKSIKIPVPKHSFLTEAYTDLSGPQRATQSPPPAASPPHQDGKARASPRLQEVSDFFKDVDHDIEKLIQSSDHRGDIFPHPASDLSARLGVGGRRVAAAGQGGAWGLQWWNLVVAMLLIGVVLPIFYAVYLKTKASGEGHETSGVANMSAGSTGSGLGVTGSTLGATVQSRGHWSPLVS
ncbi:lysM and putative peptidoglycan-binding domain-containing protein 4 [Gadus morhua]|uniref:LysM and putative peptidoglycan-binding domain-containing protein 4 n=1 Tax=Gadus morhua TaxID=8049 RepID=A0A8C5C015_GADMO|nr:lysM and putative peptidoglycan-binding domain-containing protein 4-like [Gadus morhua]XP_030222451.1 lysM and putative peptidoglycan-binding domain-containing protein 4-like [Gadus morhua]